MFFNKKITMKQMAGTIINKCIAKNIFITMDRLMFLLTITFLADKNMEKSRLITTGITVKNKKINVEKLRYTRALSDDIIITFTKFVDYDILLPIKLNNVVNTIIDRYAKADQNVIDEIIKGFTTDKDDRLLYKVNHIIYKA